jgi:hypothetical protein
MIDEVFRICNVSQFYEEWFLDYGSSHHLCPHQNWFSTYQAIDGVVFFWEKMFPIRLWG